MIFQVVEMLPAVISVNIVNAIATYMGMVKSLLKKGSAIKNSDMGMLKY